MSNEMFCFQCEQTADCSSCSGKIGVCGKDSYIADLQDKLTEELIQLAVAVEGSTPTEKTYEFILKGLFTTVTNVSFYDESINKQIQEVEKEKNAFLASKGNGEEVHWDFKGLEQMWNEHEDIRSLKSLILFGLRGMASYAYHAWILGYSDDEVNTFFCKGLKALTEDLDKDQLLSLCFELGEVNLKCMALLDKGNTKTYGSPVPTTVSLTVEKGPFIVVSGHDLKDLELLLEQTKGKGINIYTNGEMLPAHAYPKLKAYSHLKGNFGTAWHRQQVEFIDIPGPVLFTTNCLMPPKDNYADRIFTTSVVSYPNIQHIGEDKDFTPIIEKALELGGYDQDKEFLGANKGNVVTTGFGHEAVLSVADKIIEAIKNKDLKHIFVVGGCDGARKERNYYRDFVKITPTDTAVLTLACGKYRFHDLDIGSIGGLPRIMDMGQCNDAYSAIKVAGALAEAFQCDINELPLTLVISWYEQKAVCILLTLLHLGIRNIYLGPTLPAFLSPGILDILINNYQIHPIGTPEADLKEMLL